MLENPRILIIDDDQEAQKLISFQLAGENYDLVKASNGQEALDMITRGEKFSLVLLDILMPDLSGHEVCQRIRETHLSTELPVIMITANEDVSSLEEGFQAGTNDYIIKPFSRAELVSRVKSHLHLLEINNAYSRFVPQEILKALGRDSIIKVELGDQIQGEMTVFFSDIRAFSEISERMSPRENFEFLNEYLSVVTPPIKQNSGFVDKYIGDAILALFPAKPDNALQAAIQTMKRLSEYNESRLLEGDDALDIGIGLHTGPMMMGTIGDKDRMDVTVISDAVNLASRLESLTKRFGCKIAISEFTFLKLTDPGQYFHRFLGRIQVKGKKDVVPIYEVYDGDAPKIISLKNQTRHEFEQGLTCYFSKEFAEAIVLFKHVLDINPEDKTARFYLKRSAELVVSDVPDEWYGVEALRSK